MEGARVGLMAFFLLNVMLLIATVAVNSIATRWFGTPLPQGFTLHWYAKAWRTSSSRACWVTVEVVGAVVLCRSRSACRPRMRSHACSFAAALRAAGVPAAADGAAVTYGIPMATVMYKVGLRARCRA